MDIEEKRERVALAQKYFVKSFWLSFILLLIASFICIAFRGNYLAMMTKYFPSLVARDWDYMVGIILGVWKILIIQFTLIPALVLTCMKRCCNKTVCKMD